jgi:hypothetical protein
MVDARKRLGDARNVVHCDGVPLIGLPMSGIHAAMAITLAAGPERVVGCNKRLA